MRSTLMGFILEGIFLCEDLFDSHIHSSTSSANYHGLDAQKTTSGMEFSDSVFGVFCERVDYFPHPLCCVEI
jgi:hypothetical protein